MLPFTIEVKAGSSVHSQVVYAVKKAVITGQLAPGDSFPSVRVLSQNLKINPNTAHKIVATLVGQGLLEVHPGIGTVVAEMPRPTTEQRSRLMKVDLERLVVEAKQLSLELEDLLDSIRRHWEDTSPKD